MWLRKGRLHCRDFTRSPPPPHPQPFLQPVKKSAWRDDRSDIVQASLKVVQSFPGWWRRTGMKGEEDPWSKFLSLACLFILCLLMGRIQRFKFAKYQRLSAQGNRGGILLWSPPPPRPPRKTIQPTQK